jgi:hypothetical protein
MMQISRSRPLFLAANAAGLAMLLLTWQLGDGGPFLLIAFFIPAAGCEAACRFLATPGLTPYMGMAFSPLLLLHYSSTGDFRIRLACFILLLYILILARWRGRLHLHFTLDSAHPGSIWLPAFLVFAMTAVIFHERGIQLSGDEPHYLMMSQSLVEDHDLDLKNNVTGKTYMKFLPVELRFHGMVNQGKYRSFHLPGISFLLAPGFAIYNLLGGSVPADLFFRLCAALLNAFFALGLFQAIRVITPGKGNTSLFLLFLTTFPLVFHAVHLYPELPAATLMIYAYLFQRNRNRCFLPGLLLAFIPWLHLKYGLPAALLALFIMMAIWRQGSKDRMRRLGLFLLSPAVSLLLLSLYSKVLYGAWNPTGISPEKNFFSIPLLLKAETLLSFFLDQRDGLLLYAPLLLLFILAGKKEIREQIRDFPLWSAIFLLYVLLHAHTTVRGGYSPAARPLVFVAWIMVIFVTAFWRHADPGGQQTLFRLLAGLTVFASIWLFYYPLFLYQPVTREVTQRASGLLAFLSSEAVDLAALFPSFLKKDNSAYLPNYIWLGALALAAAAYYTNILKGKFARSAHGLYAVFGTALLFLVCFFPHVQLRTRYAAAGFSFYCNSRNFVYRQEASAFRFMCGRDYDLFFDLQGSTAGIMNLRFSHDADVSLKVTNGTHALLEEKRAADAHFRLRLRQLKPFTLGRKTLVHLGIETTSLGKNTFVWMKME